MFANRDRHIVIGILNAILFFTAISLGLALGTSVAANKNTSDMDELVDDRPALPSRVLDINGDLITEFFSDEKRQITPITALPENQVYAILTREDAPFFKHTGFSLSGFLRALYQTSRFLITGKGSLQGASTITMQLAGSRYADRTDISLSRKLKELWWAYQLERRFTKQEILEQYINTVYFGHNTYGVEAASQFFFGHSSVDNSPAESVILAIQLAGSGLYSPIIKPNDAKKRQREILNQMVSAGYVSKEVADQSFDAYWDNFDWSRSSTDSPYFNRLNQDKAPYFSEYIRSEITKYLFGQQDIYRDGFTIHTTLNLQYQALADEKVSKGLELWNEIYKQDHQVRSAYGATSIIQTIDLISLVFNIPTFHAPRAQQQRQANLFFTNELTPIIDALSMTFGMSQLKNLMNISLNNAKKISQMNNVETALVTLENKTGYILSMVGGTQFNRNNQFNRAVDARLMPGSAFKPLYYSAAISNGQFTPSTLIYDGPELFINPDGTPYVPGNYFGRWHGNVLLRDALALSLNIPALKVLDTIGFDAAINRSAALLGIHDPQTIARTFDRVYPLGLGTLSVTPLQLSQAFATMANQGREVTPLAIRYIEDRDGNFIANPERDLRELQERQATQVISPQVAYIMTSLLQSTVSKGTLAYARRSVDGFDGMPMAGKTGTTQNWTDAWTIGFSPYYTTAIWIGFDRRGNSLGRNQTGATSTGPVWADYMKAIHKNLPRINFARPESGIVDVKIDTRTGMLPTEDTPEEYTRMEVFLAGTAPRNTSPIARFQEEQNNSQSIRIAVDSSNLNIQNSIEAVKATQDLFSELGLEPKYLEDTSNTAPFQQDSPQDIPKQNILD